jgi:hypothetical protein
VIGPGDRPTLHTGLSILWPEKSVEIVVRTFERPSLFEAPMSTLFHGSLPVHVCCSGRQCSPTHSVLTYADTALHYSPGP